VTNRRPKRRRRRLGEIVRRRAWIVLAPALAALVSAAVFSLLQPNRYAASTRLVISQPGDLTAFNPQTGIRQDQTREVQLQADVLTGSLVQQRVRGLIGQAPAVTAIPLVNADVIVVEATAPTPTQAETIVDAYVRAYTELRQGDAAAKSFAILDQTLRQYQSVTDALAARPIVDGTIDAQQRVLLLQQGDLRERLDQVQVSGGATAAGVRPLGPATALARPVSPRPALAAIVAMMAGGLFGLIALVAVEVLDDTITGPGDLGPRASSLPCLGEVPAIPRASSRGVVALDEPDGSAAEVYRTVRTGLPFVGGGAPKSVVQLTSPSSGEGKTTTATNLAVTVAAGGRRVCLVSGDLRRPQVEELLDVPREPGLTSVVLGEDTLADALVPVERQHWLTVLPAGRVPPNPAELIGSQACSRLFAALREQFDLVVVDSAPALPVTDAAVLSGLVDATVVVVAAERTTKAELDRTLEVLDQVRAPVVALVVNHVRADRWSVPRPSRRGPTGR